VNASLLRPQPVTGHKATPVDRDTPPEEAVAMLWAGRYLIVTDHYRTGLGILKALEHHVGTLFSWGGSHAERQAASTRFDTAAVKLLAPIVAHEMAIADGYKLGFFQELYQGLTRFELPFVECQRLAGAHQRYIDGVHLAVLGHKLHPYFGTYAPSRVSHLELFGTWLSQYEGPRHRVLDVGTGCGVLAFMLAKAGFGDIVATDNNPNAIESINRDLMRRPSRPPITPILGDLLGPGDTAEDLVVFNPPWIQGKAVDLLDTALYFEPGLFQRFFDQALTRLSPNGQIVLLFSNIGTLLRPDLPHPIEVELSKGRLKLLSKLERRIKPKPDAAGKRRKTKERVQVWTLGRESV